MSVFGLAPSKLAANVERVLRARLVPIVRSSPGIGKSDIINALGRTYRVKIYDFRLSQADVTDLNGLPFRTEDGRADFLPFAHFPLEGDELPPILDAAGELQHDDAGEVIRYEGWLLFFDELTSAPKQLQAASYKVLLERLIGNRKLHDKVMVCCAGNLTSDQAVTHEMSTALQSRLVHLYLKYDHREWMTWAAKNNIDFRIMGFLEFQPENGHKFDPNHTDDTFACPRTWEFASKLILGTDVTTEDLPLLAGTVSSGVAQAFVAFCQIYAQLPSVADIIANPKTATVPTEPSTQYAMATHIAEHIDAQNAAAFVEYLNRYRVEFRVITLRLVDSRQPALIRHPAIMGMWQGLVAHM